MEINNLEVKRYFDDYISNKNLMADLKNYARFLTEKVFEEFYENENFSFDELFDENFIFDKTSLLLKFSDLEVDNSIYWFKCNTIYENYSFENFESDLEKIKSSKDLEEYKVEGVKIYYLIYCPFISQEVRSKILKFASTMENFYLKIYDENDVLFQYTYKNRARKVKDIKLKMKKADSFFRIEGSHYDVLVAQVLATSIAEAWKKSTGQILQKNLRGFKTSRKLDKEIRETIAKEPRKFVVLNNGLTAFAKNLANEDCLSGRELKFDEFYIINGGQTTKLLAESINSSHNNFEFKDLTLLIKIVIPHYEMDNADELINQISWSSNQQKPIKNRDLWTNEEQLIRWSEEFNKLKNDLQPFIFQLKDQTIKKTSNEIIVDLPLLIQLTTTTFWANPVLAKNNKSKLFEKTPTNNIRKTFKKLDLNNLNVQFFLYDIFILNKAIDDIANDLKKKNLDEDSRKNLYKILTTGKFFIIETIYIFHLILNLSDLDKEKLLNDLSLSATSQDKENIFRALSAYSELVPILNRKEYIGAQKVSRISGDVLSNLEKLIYKMVAVIGKKGNWTALKRISTNNHISIDWLGIFKNKESGWGYVIDFIEEFLKSYLYEYDDSELSPDLINSCIV